MNLVEYVFAAARALDRSAEPAIVCGERRVSYADLYGAVRRFAGATGELGVAPGDRVAIVARDIPEFVVSFLGAAAAGAVAVPLSTMLSADELAYMLDHCGAKAAVATSDQLEKVAEARRRATALATVVVADDPADFDARLAAAPEADVARVAATDLAFMLYSSGSTGLPKGATHHHAAIPYTVETYCKRVLKIVPRDRLFSASRLFFAYGLGNSLSFPLASGATSVLCEERPTPPVVADVFERHRPTVFFGVPAVFRALVDYAWAGGQIDTSSIRFCVSAGERLPERTLAEWRDLTGLDVLDGVGSTEMLHIFISNTHGRVAPGSTGTPVPGYEAKLLDASGAEIAGEGSGRLYVRGASASPGYWRDPEKTAETMAGGWVATGDVYRRDADGLYWHEGRSDDLFKVKGLWVSPVEIEEALVSCPEVSEAAVVAGTDEEGAGIAVAYVVLAAGAGEDALDAVASRVRARLPGYKCPARYHAIDALPRTATGKIQRFKLRAR
jgi:benzoate-CoA ligase family protein